MLKNSTRNSLGLLGAALTFLAGASLTWSCSNNPELVAGEDGGGGDDGGGGGAAGGSGLEPGDPGFEFPSTIDPTDCETAGGECGANAECCSGVCDNTSGRCGSSIQACRPTGEQCVSALDCCGLGCIAGVCAEHCISDGQACAGDEECCGGKCASGSCAALNASCKTGGNECSDGSECCSTVCTGGYCQLSASYCVQKGDACREGSDCCTGVCTVASGASLGVCGDSPPGPSNCSAGVAGTICGDCGECCSRLCAPYGESGVKICQPASGCRLTGELCRSDLDCCGGDPDSGLPGAGNVTCAKEPGEELGICRNALSCSPQGNVCHFKDYACSVSSAANKCCGGTGNSGVCQLDTLGVPRCTGLGDECRQEGETCSSSIDCCDETPCTADSDGIFRCRAPGCGQSGTSCTVNADCCSGTRCVQAVGSTAGVCMTETDDPPGGTGGGGTEACAEYGQACDVSADCCGDVPCNGGVCIYIIR